MTETTEAILQEQAEWGLSVWVARLDPALDEGERIDAIEVLTGTLRAQVLLGGSSPELVASWAAEPPSRGAVGP